MSCVALVYPEHDPTRMILGVSSHVVVAPNALVASGGGRGAIKRAHGPRDRDLDLADNLACLDWYVLRKQSLAMCGNPGLRLAIAPLPSTTTISSSTLTPLLYTSLLSNQTTTHSLTVIVCKTSCLNRVPTRLASLAMVLVDPGLLRCSHMTRVSKCRPP